MKETGPDPTPTPDLIIIPQTKQVIPGDHLTPPDQHNVLESWKAWGNTPPPPPGDTWAVMFIHIIDDVPTVTAIRDIPRIID